MATDPIVATDEGVDITVWVVPKARSTEIAGRHDDAIRIRVSQPPEEGRANRAVVRLLEAVTGGDVHLVAGSRSRRKRFTVVGVPIDVVRRSIES